MTSTRQLDAYIAAIQLDNALKTVVLSYHPTREMLVEEAHERRPDDIARRRLLRLLSKYRWATIELAETLVELREQCGTDPDDLPVDDDKDDVFEELGKLRAAHAAEKGGAT
jgi:hypothetical protein